MILIDPAHDPWPLWTPALDLAQRSSWRVQFADWQASQWQTPVLLQIPNDVDLASLPGNVRSQVAGLALEFPSWTDGRAYSQATLWRRMAPPDSLLAATGDVVIDMLPWLKQLGVNLVYLRADQSRARAAEVLRLAPDLPARGWHRLGGAA